MLTWWDHRNIKERSCRNPCCFAGDVRSEIKAGFVAAFFSFQVVHFSQLPPGDFDNRQHHATRVYLWQLLRLADILLTTVPTLFFSPTRTRPPRCQQSFATEGQFPMSMSLSLLLWTHGLDISLPSRRPSTSLSTPSCSPRAPSSPSSRPSPPHQTRPSLPALLQTSTPRAPLHRLPTTSLANTTSSTSTSSRLAGSGQHSPLSFYNSPPIRPLHANNLTTSKASPATPS